MKSAASVIAFAASALAATIEIQVSGVFTPDSVTASPGDVLQFNFESQHSVVRSEYDSPCVGATDNAIYSGAMSSGSFSFLVNSTDPLWLYCGVGRHCQGGQVMVVNPPSGGDQTLDNYRTAAGNAGNSQNPQGVQGGIVGTAAEIQAGGDSASASPSTDASASISSAIESAAATATGDLASVSALVSESAASAAASATGSSDATKVGAMGIAGVAGVFAALLA